MLVFQILAAAFAVFMLARHLPRAVLFLAPGLLRTQGSPAAPPRSAAEARARDDLARLGFFEVGTLRERGPLGALAVEYAVHADRDGKAFADVAKVPESWVRLVSPCADGAALVTSTGARTAAAAASERRAVLAGASVDAAVAAHRKGLVEFERAHGPAAASPDLDARIRAARDHARGEGGRALRAATAVHLANAVLAAAVLAAAVKALLPALKP